MGKCSKSTHWWKLGNWYPYFSRSVSVFLPSDSWLGLLHQSREIHCSSHQHPIAMDKAFMHILWEEHRKLVFILFPKCESSFPSDSYPILYFITEKMHAASHQYLIAFENATKHFSYGMPYCMGNEMHDFFNQFLVAWENVAKSIPWDRTEI